MYFIFFFLQNYNNLSSLSVAGGIFPIQKHIFDRRKAKEDNKGVLINCCSPGFVQTDMTSQNQAGEPLEVGARTSIWLADIPAGMDGPQGCYLAEI